ncbi:hypothetical protein HK102_007646, partial [Quaeritorhiza haematococci]
MLTLKQFVIVLAISTTGSRCVVALPQTSELEDPMPSIDLTPPRQEIATPDVPEMNEVDPRELPHVDDDDQNDDSDSLDVSRFKKGCRRFGYPHWGGRNGLQGYGRWGYGGWRFGKKGFPNGRIYSRFGKKGFPYGGFHGRFGRKGFPHGGFYGKKDAEFADLDVARAEDIDASEDEATVSSFKGGWGYGYGAYPFFVGKKEFRRFGWG